MSRIAASLGFFGIWVFSLGCSNDPTLYESELARYDPAYNTENVTNHYPTGSVDIVVKNKSCVSGFFGTSKTVSIHVFSTGIDPRTVGSASLDSNPCGATWLEGISQGETRTATLYSGYRTEYKTVGPVDSRCFIKTEASGTFLGLGFWVSNSTGRVDVECRQEGLVCNCYLN